MSNRQQLSIHGRDKNGKPGAGRYNPCPVVDEAIPTDGYASRRAAARASRKDGNTGGAIKGKKI